MSDCVIIDSGKQGVIFKAPNGNVKKVHNARRHFQTEMNTLIRLKGCACVPQIIDYDLPTWSIIMTHIPGIQLKKINRVLTAEETTKMIEGIAKINAKGVVHGDLCSTNILVGKEGEITFIDFGLSEPKCRKRKRGREYIEIEYTLFNTCPDIWCKMDRKVRKNMSTLYQAAFESFV